MSTSGAQLRAVAATVVNDVVSGGRSLDRALAEHEAEVAQRDLPLLRNLSYGVLRNYWHLEVWLAALLSRPLKARDRIVQQLLLIGLYQLSDTRIPDHAVVSETVAATRRLRRPKLSGLVNAVLRRFLREDIGSMAMPTRTAEYDHPEWLIDQLQQDWPEHWPAILQANNARAPMWLRVNTTELQTQDYLASLQAQSIEASTLTGLPQALRLANPQPVALLPGFAAGQVSVQDAAAQLAAPWLLEQLRGRVLDACAAPGGKSAHLLEIGGADIALTSLDADQQRLASVTENLDRLGFNATIQHGDASKPDEWWDGQPFDAILVDAPCSATGVIRRHPDIKHLRRAADIAVLADTQAGVLQALWPTLRPGGRLLYVTCSVLSAENDAVVQAFLDATADAEEADLLQNNNIRDLMQNKPCGQQVLPGTAGLDGFYFACLHKTE